MSEQQTAASAEDLDALPVGSVVIGADGYGEVYRKLRRRHDGIKWYEFGYEHPWDSSQVHLPAKVLHIGDAK